jgi:hypothetical protein
VYLNLPLPCFAIHRLAQIANQDVTAIKPYQTNQHTADDESFPPLLIRGQDCDSDEDSTSDDDSIPPLFPRQWEPVPYSDSNCDSDDEPDDDIQMQRASTDNDSCAVHTLTTLKDHEVDEELAEGMEDSLLDTGSTANVSSSRVGFRNIRHSK